MGTKHQPKLVTLMNKKLKNIQKCQNEEEKFELAQMCFKELASQLVTFGPVLKVIQNERRFNSSPTFFLNIRSEQAYKENLDFEIHAVTQKNQEQCSTKSKIGGKKFA